MRDKPYPGMGNVSKAKGLYFEEEIEGKKENNHVAIFSRRTPFAGIPIELVKEEPDVPNIVKYLYVVYDSFADNRLHFTFAGRKRIAKIMSRNVTTISRLTTILKETGWITIISRGQGKPNIVILHQFKNEVITKKEIKAYKTEVKRKIDERYKYGH